METLEKQAKSQNRADLYEGSKLITQAHINQLTFVIERLEEILDSK